MRWGCLRNCEWRRERRFRVSAIIAQPRSEESEAMKSELSNRAVKLAALVIVLIHFVISILHGRAHQAAMVTLTTFGYVYVGVVITLMPLVAAALLFTRKKKIGAGLLALAMFGRLIYEPVA